MARLIYSAITSLDGYVADEDGSFDWAEPDEEVHAFVNELERPIGTYLYGRRLYEVMAVWETAHALPDRKPVTMEFAELWQAADKVVYSRTLKAVATARTRLERDFDPEAVRQLKVKAERDLTVRAARYRDGQTELAAVGQVHQHATVAGQHSGVAVGAGVGDGHRLPAGVERRRYPGVVAELVEGVGVEQMPQQGLQELFVAVLGQLLVVHDGRSLHLPQGDCEWGVRSGSAPRAWNACTGGASVHAAVTAPGGRRQSCWDAPGAARVIARLRWPRAGTGRR